MKKLIVLISGKARTGKNQFAEYLIDELKKQNLSVKQDAFANGVKNGSKEDFKHLINFLNNYTERVKAQVGILRSFDKNIPEDPFIKVNQILDEIKTKDENWYETKNPITRLILQAYGTEIFRKRVDGDYWPKQLKKRFLENDADVTVVTDTRFPNEIELFNNIDDYNVITIRVIRDVKTDPTVAAHESEIALDNWTSWNYIIENNSTLEELKGSASSVAYDMILVGQTPIRM